jgi:modulator of FtsH protease HflC
MNKNVGILILVVLLVGMLGLMLIAFQVRETELAYVTRLGKPVRTMSEPGLYFKLPTPIEKYRKYDARMRVYEAEMGETPTKGAVPIIMKTYVVWRIRDALAFFNSTGTVKQAEKRLYAQIGDTQNRIVGQHAFSDFVNNNADNVKIDQIQKEMLADLKLAMEGEYGIEISTLGIKQFKIDKATTEKVFDRMRRARETKTQAIIAKGTAEATKITSAAISMRDELLAATEARAKAIRGQGDAQAAEYLEMLKQEPKLAIFLKELESMGAMLGERTTIILPMGEGPFDLLKGTPDIKTWNKETVSQ